MKRYINFVILFVLCTLFPCNGFSQNPQYGEISAGTYTGAQFLAKAKNGGIKLTGNVTVSSTIEITGNLTIDLNGCVLNGNGIGQVLEVEGGAKLIINDSAPTISHAGKLDDYGVFYWTNANDYTHIVKGGIILNKRVPNNETTNTTGIWVSGTCVINKASIIGCYSKGIGAAVTVTSSGTFEMKGGQISYNYSTGDGDYKERAGVIYGEPSHKNSGSSISISNTTISDNNTGGNGGAICGYNVVLNNCTIERNTTTKNGGAIYVRSSNDASQDATATLSITSCTIKNNEAVNGGGIYADSDVVTTISGNTTISTNVAKHSGGGIYAEHLTITGTNGNHVLIERNEAVEILEDKVNGRGGGIYVVASCNINYCTINQNYTAVYGGGIYSGCPTNIENSNITNNLAMVSETSGKLWGEGRGGGFFFTGNGNTVNRVQFTLKKSLITGNAAMYYGGGGQIQSAGELELIDSFINENTAVLHGAGGLHVTGSAKFVFTSGSISKNLAHYCGGGIHSSYTCKLDLKGGEISDNIVYGRGGGGVHVNTGGDITLAGTKISNNKVYLGNKYKYSTVIKDDDGIYTWTDPKINGWDTVDGKGEEWDYSGYGGGVLLDCCTGTMGTEEFNAGDLSGNYAVVGGGGIALIMVNVTSKSYFDQVRVVNFTLNNGKIINNTTEGDGAGIYMMENKSQEGYDKLGNEAPEKTDDIEAILDGVPQMNLYGGSIQENVAQKNGGGAYQEAGTANINGTLIDQNQAIENGGGLYLGAGNLNIGSEDNQIQNLITKNKAQNGGAFSVTNGTVNIQNCELSENVATNLGGGLYVYNTETDQKIVTFSGGQFTENKAKYGGGVALSGNIALTMSGDIENNQATNGGGLYLGSGGTMSFGNGLIRFNKADLNTESMSGETAYQQTVTQVTGIGGGLFMDSNTSLKFTDNEHLGLYGNEAANGADDIFANGKGTSVHLPVVTDNPETTDVNEGMQLSGFQVPVDSRFLFWVKDYITNDTKYGESPEGISEPSLSNGNDRYRDAATNSDLRYWQLLAKEEYFNYISVALGYRLLYATITKQGLADGESAIFNIYRGTSEDEFDENKPYASVLLTGSTGVSEVSKRIALMEGWWKVKETEWTWNYTLDLTTPSPSSKEILQGGDNTFIFKNNLNSTEKKKYDEAIKVNTMGTSSSGTSENK